MRASFTGALVAAFLAGASFAGTRALRDVVPDYMVGDLETAIIPTPQKALLHDTVFPAGKVAVALPERYDAPDTVVRELRNLVGADLVSLDQADTLVVIGRAGADQVAGELSKPRALAAEMKLAERGEDAYLLYAAANAGGRKNLVVLRGNAPPGDLWALATLRQMAFTRDATLYIREGTVVDFPRFRFRGNKRPRLWEWRYKANYGWFFKPRVEKPRRPDENWRWDYFRHHGAWVRHGSPLTATDAEMDRLVCGGEETREGKRRRVRGAEEAYRAGCREFVLKFDDTGSRMSEATRAAFGRDFYKALHHYLVGMHRRIKALDPKNRVCFMPRPYWFNNFELTRYARSLLAQGPLPEDIGLSVCGPEVLSYVIPTACLREYREIFGLKGKAQIYDNRGRGGDFFPCEGRDPDLWKEVLCLFPERGTPLTRITVYDYLWNPEAYDPKRSLRLAVRELASRRPEVYAPLLDYILYYNANRWPRGYPPREKAVASFRESNRTLKAKYEALGPVLERSPMAREVSVADELWGPRAPRPSFQWGEFSRLRRRLEFEPYMAAFGWQEARVAPTTDQMSVDGRLDEPAWGRAPRFDRFARPGWGMKTPPGEPEGMLLAGEEATGLRLLYSKTHLYVGIEFAYRHKPALPNWARELWKDLHHGQQGDYAWRVPCFEVFFDVNGQRTDYYQVISNIAGIWLSKHFGVYEPRRRGECWRPRWRFAFAVGEKRGVFEAAIPFADLVATPPKRGEVWGFQCFRSKMGTFGLFSGTFDLVGGDHAPSQFGRIVFQ